MRRAVVLGPTLVYVYNDSEAEAIEELKELLVYGTVSSCRKALKGLHILMERRYITLAEKLDKLLAEVIRNGGCPDL